MRASVLLTPTAFLHARVPDVVSVSAGMRSQLPHVVFALAGSQATHRLEMHGKRGIVQRQCHHNHRMHKTETVKQCVTHPRVPVLLGRRQQHLIERLFFCWYIILSAGFPRSTLHDDSAKTPCLHRSSLTHTHTHTHYACAFDNDPTSNPPGSHQTSTTAWADFGLARVETTQPSICMHDERVPLTEACASFLACAETMQPT